MTYHTILPPERLRNVVRFFWVLESDKPYTHYSMADVCPELLFHYNGRFNEVSGEGKTTPSFVSGVHGQTSAITKFQIDKGFGVFGVYLYPQAISLLFNLPATELTGRMPDLHTLLKQQGNELEQKMLYAVDNQQRVEIISAFIERRLSISYTRHLPVFSCIQRMIGNKGCAKIKQLAGESFLSERQFERHFKQFSGFTPKLFSRIVRFQSATALYGRHEKSLTDIAYESGYYDQSHFIHDFKKFSGHYPKAFFSGHSAATEWRN